MSAIRRVVCAMSGGVDSSVSALLLKKMGFQVEGVFMKNWDLTNETGVCSQDQDLEDAHYVCQKLDIPLKEVNFVKEYWNDVFSQLIDGYEQGFTPNPDVLCNRHVKFGHLYRHVMEEMGADALATGHYCRNSNGQFLQHYKPGKEANLLVGIDPIKDQSLFLAQISQQALQHSMFPVGGYMKHKVKAMARDEGLERISSKKESMGICFIGSRNFQSFIDEYLPPQPGQFVDIESGQVVGQHNGIHYWTLGQRAHLGGRAVAYFVQSFDPHTQTVYVAPGTRHPSLFCDNLIAEMPHWISPPPSPLLPGSPPLQCTFKYQHIHPVSKCAVFVRDREEVESEFRAMSGSERNESEEGILNKTDSGIGVENSFSVCNSNSNEASQVRTKPPTGTSTTVVYDEYDKAVKDGRDFSTGDDYVVDVRFEFPLRAVAPGQYAVFYSGDVCLGSARILRQGPTLHDLGNREPVKLLSTFT